MRRGPLAWMIDHGVAPKPADAAVYRGGPYGIARD